MIRALVGLFVAGVLVCLTGSPASAHASLLSSDPEEGSVVADLPAEIVLTFNEPIRVDSVSGFAADGSDWEISGAGQDNRLVVTPEEDPGTGTVVVAWSVVSEDGHPVNGALSFSIGTTGGGVTPAATGEPSLGVELARWVSLGVTLAALAVVLALGVRGVRRPLLVRVWYVAFVPAVLLVPLAELADSGGDLGGMRDWLVWLDGVTRWPTVLLLAGVVFAAVLVAVGSTPMRIVLAVAVLASVGGAAFAPAPVRTPPAAAEAADSAESTSPAVLGSADLGDAGIVALTVTPVEGRTYDVQIRLVDPDDGPLAPIEPPTLTLRSDQIGLGEPELEEVGESTYQAEVVIPHDGAWDAQVSVRLSEFDNPVAVVPFTLG